MQDQDDNVNGCHSRWQRNISMPQFTVPSIGLNLLPFTGKIVEWDEQPQTNKQK